MTPVKQASLGTAIGAAEGKLGGSPTGWIPQGGPLMGSIAQSLLLGGLGWGAGRIAGAFMPRINAKRLGIVAGLGAASLPWLSHAYALGNNYKQWQDDPARQDSSAWQRPGDFLRAMNRTYQPLGYPRLTELQDDAPVQTKSWMDKPVMLTGTGIGDTAEKLAGYFGGGVSDGYGIPVAHTIGMISTDPMLSSYQKAQAINFVQSAQPSGSGIISWPTVSRAAVGAGIGYAAATLFGKALDTVFGGLSSPSQRKLQGAGTIAGILMNTGAIR